MPGNDKYVYLFDILNTSSEELQKDLENGVVDINYISNCLMQSTVETSVFYEDQGILLDSTLVLTLALQITTEVASLGTAMKVLGMHCLTNPAVAEQMLVQIFHIALSAGVTFERERHEHF